MKEQVVTVADSSARPDVLELGTWLGRHQAFAWIASKCSAADAHSLRLIRERKLYRSIGLSWEEFCGMHAGVNAKTAGEIIARLKEFGEAYFNLSQILHITAPEYRALAPAVEDNAVEFEGRRIPITRENVEQLVEVVRTLRAQSEKRGRKNHPAKEPDPFDAIESRLNACLNEISARIRRGLSATEAMLLISSLDAICSRIGELQGEASRQLDRQSEPAVIGPDCRG